MKLHPASNRYVLAGATMAVALGIGFVMQRGVPDPLGAPAPTPEAHAIASGAGMTAAGAKAPSTGNAAPQAAETTAATPQAGPRLPDPAPAPETLTGIDFTSAPLAPRPVNAPRPMPEPPAREIAAQLPETPASEASAAASQSTPEPACDVALDAAPLEAGRARISLVAPCLPEERLTLHHDGLMFTAVTDADGALTRDVPALSESAVFIAAFSNGEGAVAQVAVPDATARARVVLQWRGAAGLQLHAFVDGARYGEPGHVHAEVPGAAPAPERGFLTRLGSADAPDALITEVYTFPAGERGARPEVSVTVEAEVTAANCNQEITAETLGRVDGTLLQSRRITVFMPDCAAEGDFLLLKNLYEDMKIAGR